MRTLLKWLLILVAGLLGIGVAALALLYITTGSRLTRVYDVEPVAVQIPDEPLAELDGFQQMMVTFCQDCHGPALAGQIMEEDPLVGTLAAPNLTAGKGGIAGSFSDRDWLRAVRHGIDDDGTPLLIMPSNFFIGLGERDLVAILAHIKNLPPVDNEISDPVIGPMGRFFLLQDPSILPAEVIDHSTPLSPGPEPGVTIERGEYLAVVCTLCHGPDLSGGPSASSGLNLTPGGNVGSWTEEDFIQTIRTGTTPEGNTFDPIEMPYKQISMLSDDDLKAIWLYLKSLPPVETQAPAEGGS